LILLSLDDFAARCPLPTVPGWLPCPLPASRCPLPAIPGWLSCLLPDVAQLIFGLLATVALPIL